MVNNYKQKKSNNEWANIPAGDIFSFVRSHAFSRENLTTGLACDGKVGNIHYGDIHSSYKAPSINLNKMPIPLIADPNFKPSDKDLLVDGDLIMADASEDYEGIGVTVSVHGVKDKRVVGGLHTFVLRDEKGITNEYYRQYIFRNPAVRNKLQKVANGVSVYGISKTEVSKIILPIPPLPEQNRIVAVLETWDKAIERLTQKIEIKKKIKKGLMQRLLTGKVRLPGFSEEWKHTKLGDISTLITKGTTPTTNGFAYQDSGVRFIKIESIDENGALIKNKCSYISDEANQSLKRSQLNEGDLLFSIAGALGRVYLVNKNCLPANTNQALAIIRLNESKGALIDFVYLYLQSSYVKNWTKEIYVQMAQANISLGDISKLVIVIPGLEEQKAIIKILTNINKEIACLEMKLFILKAQKNYLLNNLITGKIRTPENLLCNNVAGPDTMNVE